MKNLSYINTLLYCYLVALAISCSSKEDNKDKKNISATLKTIKEIKIPIDKSVAIYSSTVDYIEEGGRSYIFKTNYNDLLFIDIKDKKIAKRLSFPEQGPNGVGNISQAYYHANDSVFLLTDPYHIIHVNSKLEKVNNYRLDANTEAGQRGIYPQNNNKIIFYNNSIIGFMHPKVHPNKKAMLLNTEAFVSLNCNTKDAIPLPLKFPELLQDPNDTWDFIHFRPTTILVGKQLIVSFPASDSIYLFSLETNKVKRFSGKSRHYSGKILPLSSNSFKASIDAYKSTHAYFLLKYDKFRKLFYRFVLFPTEEKTNNYSLENLVLMKPFSVQIFNEKFELIGETEIFKANTFNFVDCFVSREGLLISNNHPKNPKTNEDFLSYSLFAISKLQ
ncbi:DUF4221 family protein [Runella slithyformis]|uniref:DUF4221 domain-containing protein n=1 Tax=Runella slithyformis (strain ATCC 29530 / DSM 19594 / LMG 11500 / NCIMB 11436 / LSU 4) TaxID=761193 RepID=A0A7U3ZLZ0_RUNSL|nr:DUF4221 family protein [Runella slithyformis]AEI49635.1 hypothetical protein Runsl_3260 [Runella slithyformis DSM 19594]